MNKAAQSLGRKGGKATSVAKRKAARSNWKKAVAAIKRKAANYNLTDSQYEMERLNIIQPR